MSGQLKSPYISFMKQFLKCIFSNISPGSTVEEWMQLTGPPRDEREQTTCLLFRFHITICVFVVSEREIDR